ncbi:MAG TPA: YqgE/AlgH family protein [Gammaproteobacteria bacterium]|nr:YqgE/AlgH family protein [Gammaproteobacteria bacterium]
MTDISYFGGHFLVAVPSLQDPNFLRSVTYICEHNADGAFGIVINRELDATISDIFRELKLTCVEDAPGLKQKVFSGGPVDIERGLVLHQPAGHWKSTLIQNNELAVTSSLDILTAIGQNQGPEKFIMVLGYAGWGAGQLEQEMAANAWLSAPANLDVIFDTPASQRWEKAAQSMGIDIRLLSSDIGHA